MSGYVIFKITDGTDEVNLLALKAGFLLKDWKPSVLPIDGIFQESPTAPGRTIVHTRFESITDRLSLAVRDTAPLDLIREYRRLLTLLMKAIDYWTGVNPNPVYIIKQAKCESVPSYALVGLWNSPQVGGPFDQPFAQKPSVFDDLDFKIEHTEWFSSPPGTGEVLNLSNRQEALIRDWTAVTTGNHCFYVPAGQCGCASDTLFVSDSGVPTVRYSVNGTAWVVSATPPTAHVRGWTIFGGYLYAFTANGVFRSNDGGANFALFSATPIANSANYFPLMTNDGTYMYVYGEVTGTHGIYRSNGGAWALVFQTSASNIYGVLGYHSTQGCLYCYTAYNTTTPEIIYSEDGTTWLPSGLFGNDSFSGPFLEIGDYMYTAGYSVNSGVYKLNVENGVFSSDKIHSCAQNYYIWLNWLEYDTDAKKLYVNGLRWTERDNASYIDTTAYWLTEQAEEDQLTKLALIMTKETVKPRELYYFPGTTGFLYIYGSDGNLYQFPTTRRSIDRETTEKVFVTNSETNKQITHAYFYDTSAGTYTSLYPISSTPQPLITGLPPQVNDAIYICIEDSVLRDDGAFNNFILPLCTSSRGLFFTREYWNGAAWAALSGYNSTARDNVFANPPNTVDMLIREHKGHFFIPPSDFATTAVNGVTGWWVRLRVTTVNALYTVPEIDSDIYTVTWAHVEVDDEDVPGDIPCYTHFKVYPDGVVDNTYYPHRMIISSRSTERGEVFSPFINLAQENNRPGVYPIYGNTGDMSFVASPSVPAGQYAYWQPSAGGEATLVTTRFIPGVQTDYLGRYRAFLRVYAESVSDANWLKVWLRVNTGSAYIDSKVANITQVAGVAESVALVIDLGVIDILPIAIPKNTRVNNLTLDVRGDAANGTPALRLYDLCIFDVDECFVDVLSKADDTYYAEYFDIDSISDPSNRLVASSRTIYPQNEFYIDNSIEIPLEPRTGPAKLQANANQRVWFLGMRWDSTYEVWVSQLQQSYSVQAEKVSRYMTPYREA
jgi:hypothetical protein